MSVHACHHVPSGLSRVSCYNYGIVERLLTLELAKKAGTSCIIQALLELLLFVLQPHLLLTLFITSGRLIAAEVNDLVKQI